MHVWPSDGLHSAYWGNFHSGTVDGAVTGRAGYPAISADLLDTADQARLLRQVDGHRVLGRDGYTIVVHDTPLATTGIALAPAAYTPTHSACYAELIVQRVSFEQNAMTGSQLGLLLSLREFGPDGGVSRSFMSSVHQHLPKMTHRSSAPVTVPEAEAEMHDAFQAGIDEFAAAYQRPPRPPR